MKKQLQKIAFLFCVTIVSFCISSNAQIIYTDVNPDDTIQDLNLSAATYDVYHLDLNNDGITDFDLNQSYIKYSYSSGTLCYYYRIFKKCYAYAKNLNAIASDSIGGLSISSLSIINGGVSWRDTSSNNGYNNLANYSYFSIKHCPPASPAITTTGGNWYNQTDKYLGLKIIKNGLTYYGWVRLQIVSASSITVKDYAYNSIPNQPILAGQTTCALPTVNVTANGATTFCYGSSVTLTADSVSGYTFQWKKNAVAISGATARTYKVTTSGSYSVITTNACGLATSTPLSCTRILNPTPVISTTDPLTYCAGQAINTMFTANTYTGVTYQWQKNSVNINAAIAQNYTASATGKYRVRETANGCSRTSSAKSIIINCRMGEDILNASILSIYPNPANNSITLQLSSAQPAIISVTNLFGQIVYSEKINAEQTQIDVNKFPAGIYVVRWNSGNNNETKTFSVIK